MQEKSENEKLIDLVGSFQETIELLSILDPSEEEEAKNLLSSIEPALLDLELRQRFTEPEDKLSVILELNAGAGGVEAMDWCRMLLRMYMRWAESRGYKVELIDCTNGEVAGFQSVSIEIVGLNVFGLLKHENGVHRLIRNSPFDAAGKRQTSFCSVSVIPSFPEEDETIVVKKEDYIRQHCRSGGKGGQGVNTADSVSLLTHIKTGIVVRCQTERSQNENFRIAMAMLKGKLFELQQKEKSEAFQAKYQANKSDIAFGHQIRSYVLSPKQYVNDKRTDLSLPNVQDILDGRIDELLK